MTTEQMIPSAADHLVVQSLPLEGSRWKSLHTQMRGSLKKIAEEIVGDPGLDMEGALSNEDESEFEDGTLDIAFEETSIESLARIELEADNLSKTAARFRYVLNLRLEQHRAQVVEQAEAPEGVESAA